MRCVALENQIHASKREIESQISKFLLGMLTLLLLFCWELARWLPHWLQQWLIVVIDINIIRQKACENAWKLFFLLGIYYLFSWHHQLCFVQSTKRDEDEIVKSMRSFPWNKSNCLNAKYFSIPQIVSRKRQIYQSIGLI